VGAAVGCPHADLMGKYKVPHFDAKGEADAYFAMPACRRRSCSPRSTGTTDPLRMGRSPARRPARLQLPMADKKLAGIAARHRKCAYGIFRKGAGAIGKTIALPAGS